MRILTVGNMYPPHHLGGYEIVWRAAVEALRGAGHDVEVLTTDFRLDGATEAEPGVARTLRWYWRDHDFPRLGWRDRLAIERHNAGVLDARLAEFRPHVIGWWAMGGMSLSLIARAGRAGVPAVAFVNDDWVAYGPDVDGWTRAFATYLRPLAAAAAVLTGIPTRFETGAVAEWVFCSDSVRRGALSRGRELSVTSVAPSGIHERFLHPAPEREWGWRLLYVGRIDPRKGIDVAIDALAELPAQARLTVVGGGEAAETARLSARIAQLGVGERVELVGTVAAERLPDSYASADAVIFPVRWPEPFGLVPLEAMGIGRPVLATGRGGSGEYLVDGENCVLFDPDAPGTLATAIRLLAEDEALRARLRAGGLATAPAYTEARYNAAVAQALEAAGTPSRPRSSR